MGARGCLWGPALFLFMLVALDERRIRQSRHGSGLLDIIATFCPFKYSSLGINVNGKKSVFSSRFHEGERGTNSGRILQQTWYDNDLAYLHSPARSTNCIR